MARSYGSYSRERDKDKPYRTAEIALGFLGDLIAQNNQQSLDYQKLALQQEATQATADYRESRQASETLTLPTGEVMQFNPETNKYDMQIAGKGAGVQNWGKVYGQQFFDKYLDGSIVYEDTDKDGIAGSKGDKAYIGPEAQMWRDYQTAKTNNEPDFESKHPEVILENYKNYDGNDSAQLETIDKFLRGREKTQEKLDTYNQFRSMPSTTKATDVDRFYKTAEKALKPAALAPRDKISIQTLLNRKNKLSAYLEGSTEVTVYSGATEAYWNEEEGQPDASGLSEQRQTLKRIQMTPEKRKEYETEIQSINKTLTGYGIIFSKQDNDPLGIF